MSQDVHVPCLIGDWSDQCVCGCRVTPAAVGGDFTPTTAEDVTEELVNMTMDIVDGFYGEQRIDWEDVLDRLERQQLADGRGIDFGDQMVSPAIGRLQREVRKLRRLG